MNTNTANTANVPAVGTPCSYRAGSDVYPATVVAVSPSGHRVTVRNARVTEWTPFPDSRGVRFEPNPNGAVEVYTRRADGRYRPVGCDFGSLSFAGYAAHRDPSF